MQSWSRRMQIQQQRASSLLLARHLLNSCLRRQLTGNNRNTITTTATTTTTTTNTGKRQSSTSFNQLNNNNNSTKCQSVVASINKVSSRKQSKLATNQEESLASGGQSVNSLTGEHCQVDSPLELHKWPSNGNSNSSRNRSLNDLEVDLTGTGSGTKESIAEREVKEGELAVEDEKLEAHTFLQRHIGPSESELNEMLAALNFSNLDELIDATVPKEIRMEYSDLRLPEPVTEHELLEELKQLGSLNVGATHWRSFIGQGYYDCVTPAVIMRNMFENPGWSTAYTAYQAEIAQGRLESLMNYQTMISDLTGLDVANASLLDESTAAAEALQVCTRFDKKKRQRLLISTRCHPQTIAVVETRAKALGIQVDKFDELQALTSGGNNRAFPQLQLYSGLLLQYPNTTGHLFDLNKFTSRAHEAECLVVVATDLMACTLFKPPGEFEFPADLVVGSSQRFGIPLNFGGPHAGFLACRQKLVRSIPGRVVGLTRDSNGRPAYRFALQTREQHIRRDKATSNICTAQALLANMSAMYAVYHGAEGLRQIANSIHSKTSLLAQLLSQQQTNNQSEFGSSVSIINKDNYFDTLTLKPVARDGECVSSLVSTIRQRAEEEKVNLRYDLVDESDRSPLIGISLDETTKLSDIFKLASLFNITSDTKDLFNGSTIPENYLIMKEQKESTTNKAASLSLRSHTRPLDGQLVAYKRTSSYLTHPTFKQHRSEAQLVRYMKSLENKDISLANSMIPLGSCTMKLNGTSQMLASSWQEFARCHPFQPIEQSEGYLRLFDQLDEYLCEITGYDKISFQPNSGAQGEYAGLRVIKSYLESLGQNERDICLIPISAHGTNPASAQMAGFKIQTIKVQDDGEIDLEDLATNIKRHQERLACLMITYPSTFGVFETSIRRTCEMVHEAGGQVYLDGANMNAQVGLCRPGDYGSDVSHLNLHKTFCIPHGGGGPGAGPIGVKSHLVPFLPSHPSQISTSENVNNFGTVSGSMWGSAAILPISWSYVRLMGKDLKLSSQVAILNANYMRKRLESAYKILFKGGQGLVAHEFILDCRPFKQTTNIEAVDIAKRLQDFGFHAPTVSWPVSNTLMLEPTESEDKQQLDRYCDALLAIREEINLIEKGHWNKLENPIKMAPHTQQVVCSSHWQRPYTREQAAFPASFVTPTSKVWPTVGRVDDTYGDTNLFCSCGPVEDYQHI